MKWRIEKQENRYYPQFLKRTIFGNLIWYSPLLDMGVCSIEHSFSTQSEAQSFIDNGGKIPIERTIVAVT